MSTTENRAPPQAGALQAQHENRSQLSLLIDREEKRCPRIFNIFFIIIIPLLLLVCLAMFCGHFLALLESGNEKDTNNSLIVDWIGKNQKVELVASSVQGAYDGCFAAFLADAPSDLVNSTELLSFMNDCTSEGLAESKSILKEIQDDTIANLVSNDMSFDWIACSKGGTRDFTGVQGFFIFTEWLESFFALIDEYSDEEEAYALAVENASGTDSCAVNSAGGAVFWFTIMT